MACRLTPLVYILDRRKENNKRAQEPCNATVNSCVAATPLAPLASVFCLLRVSVPAHLLTHVLRNAFIDNSLPTWCGVCPFLDRLRLFLLSPLCRCTLEHAVTR